MSDTTFELSEVSTKYARYSLSTILFWCCRIFLGVLVLATGVGKALDLPGFIGVGNGATLTLLGNGATLTLLGNGATVTLLGNGYAAGCEARLCRAVQLEFDIWAEPPVRAVPAFRAKGRTGAQPTTL